MNLEKIKAQAQLAIKNFAHLKEAQDLAIQMVNVIEYFESLIRAGDLPAEKIVEVENACVIVKNPQQFCSLCGADEFKAAHCDLKECAFPVVK